MSRTVAEIKQFIYDQLAIKALTNPSIALLLLNPSETAVWKDYVFAYAVAQGTQEQLQDEFRSNIDASVALASMGTAPWLRDKIFKFQYDATIPQVLQLVDLAPQYVPVDATKRIITICCLRSGGSRIINIFAAKNTPPEALSAPELASLQDYLSGGGSSVDMGLGVGVAGVSYPCFSADPDQVFIQGTIYYEGQFSSTIKADVIFAIESYLANLGQNGTLDTLQLINAIQSVNGVKDIDILNLAIRSAATAFGSKTFIITAHAVSAISIDASAGYAKGETTAANTLSDKLTFTPA